MSRFSENPVEPHIGLPYAFKLFAVYANVGVSPLTNVGAWNYNSGDGFLPEVTKLVDAALTVGGEDEAVLSEVAKTLNYDPLLIALMEASANTDSPKRASLLLELVSKMLLIYGNWNTYLFSGGEEIQFVTLMAILIDSGYPTDKTLEALSQTAYGRVEEQEAFRLMFEAYDGKITLGDAIMVVPEYRKIGEAFNASQRS